MAPYSIMSSVVRTVCFRDRITNITAIAIVAPFTEESELRKSNGEHAG